jgi:chromosome segregation ATPase
MADTKETPEALEAHDGLRQRIADLRSKLAAERSRREAAEYNYTGEQAERQAVAQERRELRAKLAAAEERAEECKRERGEWRKRAEEAEDRNLDRTHNQTMGAIKNLGEEMKADYSADLDAALARERELREALGQLEYLDAHGCCDGDCPHDDSWDCCTALIKHIKETAEIVRAALVKSAAPEETKP